jgi:hypothetical protein
MTTRTTQTTQTVYKLHDPTTSHKTPVCSQCGCRTTKQERLCILCQQRPLKGNRKSEWGDSVPPDAFDECPFCAGMNMRWVALLGGLHAVGCSDCRGVGPPHYNRRGALDKWNGEV